MATKIFIKISDNKASEFYQGVKMTEHLKLVDSGFDVYVIEDVVFKAKQTLLVDLGIQVTSDFEACIFMYPRSSIYKTPLFLRNNVGVIDHGYRGNVKMALMNMSDDDYVLEKGKALCQLILPSGIPPKIEFVDELDETLRGDGGFGSTN